MEEASKRIENLPWIKRARVRRIVPDEVVVEVAEHNAVAAISLQDLYLVNAGGVVFKKIYPQEKADFPIITGISREAVSKNPQLTKESILKALNLIKIFSEKPCLKDRTVAEVHLDDLMGVSLVLDPKAIGVQLGHEQYAERLDRLCVLLQVLAERSLSAHSILLDQTGRSDKVAVRLDKIASYQ